MSKLQKKHTKEPNKNKTCTNRHEVRPKYVNVGIHERPGDAGPRC